jgi:hypothetical protein
VTQIEVVFIACKVQLNSNLLSGPGSPDQEGPADTDTDTDEVEVNSIAHVYGPILSTQTEIQYSSALYIYVG